MAGFEVTPEALTVQVLEVLPRIECVCVLRCTYTMALLSKLAENRPSAD